MARTLRLALGCALLAAAAVPAAGAGAALASGPAPTPASSPRSPFGPSGLLAGSRGPLVAGPPVTTGVSYPAGRRSAARVAVGRNINVTGRHDVVQRAKIGGVSVETCDPGKDTAQNETTIAAAGSTLVAGANDYRLYEPSENRYDGSGGFYRSANGGTTWTAGFLPGIVRADKAAPGPYQAAGDPSVVSGPRNTFWYSNLAFNRSDAASAVAVSRSADDGRTWSTHFAVRTSAAQGATVLNDKDWIGADPSDRSGRTAYVTWTRFNARSSPIVIAKTTNGGRTWSTPHPVSGTFTNDQSSTVVVSRTGTVYVTFQTFTGGTSSVAFAVSVNGGASFTTKVIAPVSEIPSPLPGATFRVDSFPALALGGSTLHVVWSNWNGGNADADYIRSVNGGKTWTKPATIGGGPGDQFFPWIAARQGVVFASWFSRAGRGDTFAYAAARSGNAGRSWTSPVTVSKATSRVRVGNRFSFPGCAFNFVGDYSGITVDSAGTGHALWTDIHTDPFDPAKGGADQDPYTAAIALPG